MSKFRSLKKKLLAALCAFASGVSGASANLYNDENSIIGFNNALFKPKGNISDIGKKILSLSYDSSNNGAVRATVAVYGFGDDNCDDNCDDKGGKSFAICVERDDKNGILNFVLFHCKYSGCVAGDTDELFRFSVSAEFVADKLNVGSVNLGEDWGAFLNSEIEGVTCKVKLLRIIFNDVLGLGYKFYDDAAGNFVDNVDLENTFMNNIDEGNHPDFAGCMQVLSNELHKEGGICEFKENVLVLEGDGKKFGFNGEEIWKRLTSNFENSDYNQQYAPQAKKNSGEQNGEKVGAAKEKMSNWLKAGMGVLGVGAVGGIGYALFDNLIRRPKENEEYSRMKQRLLQLGARGQRLEQEREILDRYRKFTIGKPIYKDLIKKAEGEEALEKAKGNGASKGKTRQVKKASKGSRRRSRG